MGGNGCTIPAGGRGAQYVAELRILLVYFAAELRILLVYLSESLGRLVQNEGPLGATFFIGGPRSPWPPVEPPLYPRDHSWSDSTTCTGSRGRDLASRPLDQSKPVLTHTSVQCNISSHYPRQPTLTFIYATFSKKQRRIIGA